MKLSPILFSGALVSTPLLSAAVSAPLLKDTYISSSVPSTNFGTSALLEIDGQGDERVAFVSFDISGVPKPIRAASLKFQKANGRGDRSPIIVGVSDQSFDSWNEAGLTWNNCTVRDGSDDNLADSKTTGSLGTLATYPGRTDGVTEVILNEESGDSTALLDFLNADTDGIVTFALTQSDDNGNAFNYYSDENGAGQPDPVLTVTGASGGGGGNLSVRARLFSGSSDTLQLRVNDRTVATFNLTSSYQSFSYSGDLSGNVKVYFPDNGTDARLDYIEVNGTRHEAEDQAINTSVWQGGSCGGSFSEKMHCAGYIDFGNLGTTTAPTESSGFEDGGFSPFKSEVCCGNEVSSAVPSFGARDGTRALRLKWHEANYLGTRSTRGVEMRGKRAHRHSWYGFSVQARSGAFPTDQRQAIAQLIGWSPACETNKTIIIDQDANGEIVVAGFADNESVTNNGTVEGVRVFRATLANSMPLNRWVDVVIYARYSADGNGEFKIWWDGAPKNSPTFEISGIDLGDGCFDENDNHVEGVYPKFGIYAFDVGGYTNNETREIWYDEVRHLTSNPADGFEAVTP